MGKVEERELRMSTGLSGGIGRTHLELCGALTAGVMVIGGVHGRSRPNQDDTVCQTLAAHYRERFAQELGGVNCGELRARWGRCSQLVQRAAGVLLEVLE
jgi:C_GCAxxG_C_C family probable redox protein